MPVHRLSLEKSKLLPLGFKRKNCRTESEYSWNIFEWYFNFSLFQLGWMGSRKQSTQVCGYQFTKTKGASESQSVSLFATWIGEMPVS